MVSENGEIKTIGLATRWSKHCKILRRNWSCYKLESFHLVWTDSSKTNTCKPNLLFVIPITGSFGRHMQTQMCQQWRCWNFVYLPVWTDPFIFNLCIVKSKNKQRHVLHDSQFKFISVAQKLHKLHYYSVSDPKVWLNWNDGCDNPRKTEVGESSANRSKLIIIILMSFGAGYHPWPQL